LAKSREEHAYWGKRAGAYDAATAYIVGRQTQRETERWLSSRFKESGEVLELGCGTGHFSRIIAEKAKHLTATDGSPEMLDLAKTRLGKLPNTKVLKADCYHTSLPDSAFDGVFLGNVLHIVQRPLDVLYECRRILKPGGSLVVVDATSYAMPFRSKLAMGIRYLRKFGIPPRENRIVSPDDLARWLYGAGFLLEESRVISKEINIVCMKGRRET